MWELAEVGVVVRSLVGSGAGCVDAPPGVDTHLMLCVPGLVAGAYYSVDGPLGWCTFSAVYATTGGVASLPWLSRAYLVLRWLSGQRARWSRSRAEWVNGAAVLWCCRV